MSELSALSPADLTSLESDLAARYEAFKARKLTLDMTRGKPSSEQLDLANGLLTNLGPQEFLAADGTDARNYGGLDGLAEMKALFGELLGVPATQIFVGGNSSLQLMHDTIVRAIVHGVPDGVGPWRTVKFICPTPGYDRHFAICQHHGIEMISVGMDDHGPRLDEVRRLVSSDASITGMWCVPKYSNPTGITYSDAVVGELVSMKTAAPDFRLFWDDAYAVHHLYEEGDHLANVLAGAAAAGYPNRPLVFASTSKISFAGAGIAAMGASPANITDVKRHATIQSIGPDKINQLRHVKFFKDGAGITAHMRKHAALLRPKFDAVNRIFTEELGGRGIASWTTPRGGYFMSLDTLDGCAADVVKLADEAGVKLTPSGATFPYGKDPRNRNIRIAPTMPPLAQVEAAMEVVAVCVQLASVRKMKARG